MNIRLTVGKLALSVILVILMLITSTGLLAMPVSAAQASIAAAVESGNTVIISTLLPHNFISGQFVYISGIPVAGYNGTFLITSTPDEYVFTYTNPVSGLGTSSGGTVQLISLSLTKSPNPTTFYEAGEVIVYTYEVKNTGDVTFGGGPFIINDDKLGDFQCGTATSLAPGATISCTRSYTTQPGDLSTGKITNHATTQALFNYISADESPVSIIVFSNRATATVNVAIRPMGVGGEVQSTNTAGILAPWLILTFILSVSGAILVLKRRNN